MRAAAFFCVASTILPFYSGAALAEATSTDLKVAIERGVAALERTQRVDGSWVEYESQPGGVTALCTLALLKCGRTANDHESVRKALDYLDGQTYIDRTYNASLVIMALAAADAEKYKSKINKLAQELAARQMRDKRTKGGWSYRGPEDGSADNSNTHFAMLALYEAERHGVRIPDDTWIKAAQYWTQSGMQGARGGFGYGMNRENAPTGSMTSAAIMSLRIAEDRLGPLEAQIVNGDVRCCGTQFRSEKLPPAIQWLSDSFSVSRNPGREVSLLYYLWSLEHACAATHQRFLIATRAPRGTLAGDAKLNDWYREGSEFLISRQDKSNGGWIGTGQMGENRPDVATAFALLFLAHGHRPVVIGRLQHSREGNGDAGDWNHHRLALPNLVGRVGQYWGRELTFQTVDFSRWPLNRPGLQQQTTLLNTRDLLEFPVLFLSGTQAIDLDANQRRILKEYVQFGGLLFAEACGDNQTSAAAFDESFRALVSELVPDRELTKLPMQHAIWQSEQPIATANLPNGAELFGVDVCGSTSVLYCPRSLSCYWELADRATADTVPPGVREQIEQVTRLGCNVLAYGTRRQFKERLDRPLMPITNPKGQARPGSLIVPMLRHGGGSADGAVALNYLLRCVERQLGVPVDYDTHFMDVGELSPEKHPVVFMHGNQAFDLPPNERQSLKAYLDGGGFLFAAAVQSSADFCDAVRAELRAIYPGSSLEPISGSHAVLSDAYSGFNLPRIEIRTPRQNVNGQRLDVEQIEATPLLQGLTVDGRLAAVLSPIDISCALMRGGSLEAKTYAPVDAARLGTNVLLYGLQRRGGRWR